jgi:hypothetical protein
MCFLQDRWHKKAATSGAAGWGHSLAVEALSADAIGATAAIEGLS